ncbi:hypothetical protein BASA81_007057 [Batrachochytrium salamandrivorans]|nr:hypothetical protein BASA81_010810 [Batrachochytrium salamandrivorans]KAH9254807.1 hypothetical protein BASA81_007057 [Batrachochytrium salamandrivorans]
MVWATSRTSSPGSLRIAERFPTRATCRAESSTSSLRNALRSSSAPFTSASHRESTLGEVDEPVVGVRQRLRDRQGALVAQVVLAKAARRVSKCRRAAQTCSMLTSLQCSCFSALANAWAPSAAMLLPWMLGRVSARSGERVDLLQHHEPVVGVLHRLGQGLGPLVAEVVVDGAGEAVSVRAPRAETYRNEVSLLWACLAASASAAASLAPMPLLSTLPTSASVLAEGQGGNATRYSRPCCARALGLGTPTGPRPASTRCLAAFVEGEWSETGPQSAYRRY